MLVKNDVLNKVIDAGLSRGADFCEVFIEDRRSQGVEYTDKKVAGARSNQARGAGIRLFYGLEEIYTYTNDLSEAGLIRAATTAAAALKGGQTISAQTLRDLQIQPLQHYEMRPWQIENGERVSYLQIADRAARGAGSEIAQFFGRIAETNQRVQIVNSKGLNANDERNYVRTLLMSYAERNGVKETSFDQKSFLAGSEVLKTVPYADLAVGAAKDAIHMLDAVAAPAGEMPVVIGAGFGGVIFHEACGHGLETTSVARNSSVFCGLLGKKIAHESVTAIDDGTIPQSWGSITIDDEGNPTRKTVLIEKGVLKSYIVDEMGARRTGYEITGSGRRESYKFAPTSRMRNTYIAAGTESLESLIGSVSDGLYTAKMGGGSVNPGTGEYNFAVKEAYRIRNGKICEPVRGASLIGKGIETLGRIEKVGSELAMEGGMCGSASGWVPVTSGQPPILVSKIQVGGLAQ